MSTDRKDTNNPKDAVGIRKWRYFTTVPLTVMCEVGVAMLEGARKYGRSNYRVAGVRASVYVDAAMGHITQWWEGEDIDADSKLSHITKAISSLVVLRDAMIQDMLQDDRPPKGKLDAVRAEMQRTVNEMFERHPQPVAAFTEREHGEGKTILVTPDTKSLTLGDADVGTFAQRVFRGATPMGDGGIVADKL